MKIFFGKNNKKAFMPANTKRALLFDLLDHVDISKFGAKGDYFKSLQSIWSNKKMSKTKRGLYSLDLVFDDLLTIDNFVKTISTLAVFAAVTVHSAPLLTRWTTVARKPRLTASNKVSLRNP